MTPSTDDRLRIEAAQRDPSHFGELYEEHFYRVYAYIARRVGDRHQAEDLTADVFREALASIGKFEWRGVPFSAWLLRIASRTIADHFRRSGREAGNPADEPEQPDPAEIERRAMLFELVERLPEAQFRVIHLRFVYNGPKFGASDWRLSCIYHQGTPTQEYNIMGYSHGSEYQLKCIHEDGTEESGDWMTTELELIRAIAKIRWEKGRTYWLRERNVPGSDCVDTEPEIIVECRISDSPSQRYRLHGSASIGADQYSIGSDREAQ